MRGILVTSKSSGSESRITPAYAGNTSHCSGYSAAYQDHPRLCGEYCSKCFSKPINGRITPAYAGNTSLRHHQVHTEQDHPRLCGEYGSRPLKPCNPTGSPPPMRGIRNLQIRSQPALRITPAYAGNTMPYLL